MPAASPASLALAARLRQFDETELASIIRRRRVSPAALDDLFDLAEALLDESSVASALADLPRASLIAIAAAAQLDPDGRGMNLEVIANHLGDTPDAVRRQLAEPAHRLVVVMDEADSAGAIRVLVPSGVGTHLADTAAGLTAADSSTDGHRDGGTSTTPVRSTVDDAARRDRVAAERAFEATMRIGEVTRSLQRAPARRLSRGGLSLPDARRVAADASVPEDALADHLAVARSAGLIDETADDLIALPVTEIWRTQALVDRWAALADAWRAVMPAALHDELARRADTNNPASRAELIAWLYPAADRTVAEQLDSQLRQAELLGLIVDGHTSTIGAQLLRSGGALARRDLAPLLPPDVRQVYLQHDLTIVSPGPLAADLDERLRRLADVETAGLAGRYRLSADTVTRAIAQGESATSLLHFLTELSLTGVPQPVAYLINETAQRYGTVRVGMLAADESTALAATTGVRSDDVSLIDTLSVDATLTPLGFTRSGPHRLVSRLDPGLVLGTLLDARYPAAPEEGEHPIVPTRADRRRGRAPRMRGAAAAPTDPILEAARRLHGATSSADAAGGDAWVARQWELALRAKLPVHVIVRLPDGTERAFDLEPTGIASGRVRGRDLAADVERTLPISSITVLEVPE
jgi:hypothetical protein